MLLSEKVFEPGEVVSVDSSGWLEGLEGGGVTTPLAALKVSWVSASLLV